MLEPFLLTLQALVYAVRIPVLLFCRFVNLLWAVSDPSHVAAPVKITFWYQWLVSVTVESLTQKAVDHDDMLAEQLLFRYRKFVLSTFLADS